MTQDEQGYNGWKNYPTWAVNLWLGNDEGLYNEATARVADVLVYVDHDEENVRGDKPVWTIEQARRYRVADMLKDWVTDELAPDLGASFAADLLGYALDCVEWHDIADAWVETALDRTEV